MGNFSKTHNPILNLNGKWEFIMVNGIIRLHNISNNKSLVLVHTNKPPFTGITETQMVK